MLTRSRQQGVSLIELMVSLGISLVLLLGLTSFLATSLKSNASTMKAARLNQELRAIMLLISRDVRRAGYWEGTGSNTFGTVDTSTAGCILFSYDRHGATSDDPSDGTRQDDEKYSYLLKNDVLWMRSPGTDFSCTPPDNTWEKLSDSKVTKITQLTFAGDDAKKIITITLSGELLKDSSVKLKLSETVKLENAPTIN